jgi:hypothetical protein
MLPLGLQVAVVAPGLDHDHPIHGPMEKVQDEFPLTGGVLAGTHDDDHRVVARGYPLHRLCHARVERVHQVCNEEPDAAHVVAGPQAARGHVAPEPEADDGVFHSPLHLGSDALLHVHDARNGLQADARGRGDVTHGGSSRPLRREACRLGRPGRLGATPVTCRPISKPSGPDATCGQRRDACAFAGRVAHGRRNLQSCSARERPTAARSIGPGVLTSLS